jgi:Fic family protein
MDIKDFISGMHKQQFQYKSFFPNPVNIEWQISDNNLIHLLSEADIKLGELNAFSQLVPDIDFFIKMHIFKEATTSSRIEGTQTNIVEALQKEENIDPEKRDGWQEVQNYINVMNEAIVELKKLPLSNRLLRNTHRTLLQGVRGKYKLPGEFRKSQNWIGGVTLKDAVFIPPHQDGIAHYQFETLHPFLDGNGRIGRLLITLYLVSKELLSKPTLYLSAFFEQNKALYYDNLTRVRTHNDLIQWLKYFLVGIKHTAENSIDTFKSIIMLRQKIEYRDILSLGRKTKLAQQFLHYLYSKPVIDSQEVSKEFSINTSTTLRLIDDFINLGILKEITGYKRNRIFVFSRYLKLFE